VTQWPGSVAELVAQQEALGAATPSRWLLRAAPLRIGACFACSDRDVGGRGRVGDRLWCGAACVEAGSVIAMAVERGHAGHEYEPGLLALRQGPALAAVVAALLPPPDVVLVDATGRDHPRRAGLALHLGAVLDLPTIGVTHRPLLAAGDAPGPEVGDAAPLLLDGEIVGAWLRTAHGARPIAVHAAWRTDVETAIAVVRTCSRGTRTPEPLREARHSARAARAAASATD
jgi:deoxyribonuclease V